MNTALKRSLTKPLNEPLSGIFLTYSDVDSEFPRQGGARQAKKANSHLNFTLLTHPYRAAILEET
jgi:hypothetical protein